MGRGNDRHVGNVCCGHGYQRRQCRVASHDGILRSEPVRHHLDRHELLDRRNYNGDDGGLVEHASRTQTALHLFVHNLHHRLNPLWDGNHFHPYNYFPRTSRNRRRQPYPRLAGNHAGGLSR